MRFRQTRLARVVGRSFARSAAPRGSGNCCRVRGVELLNRRCRIFSSARDIVCIHYTAVIVLHVIGDSLVSRRLSPAYMLPGSRVALIHSFSMVVAIAFFALFGRVLVPRM